MSAFLYELINSLSTSEKVYFKRNARTHGSQDDKNYLKIYDLLEGMESFDKQAFSAFFEGTTIDKYRSSEIAYLKEKILVSLFNQKLNKSKRNQIQKGILIIEVLAAKGFRKEALKKLQTIKKHACKQEEFTWILRLIELEEMILFKEGILGYKEKLEELHEQRSDITSKIQNLNQYHILRQEIREFQFSKYLISNDIEAFHDLSNHPFVKDSSNCFSVKAKEHWYYIQVLMNYLRREFNLGLSISAEYVQFMFLHKQLFDLNKTLPALSNYVFHACLTKDKSHFELGQKILLQFSDKKEVPQFYLNYILYTRNLEFAYYAHDFALMGEYLALTSDLLRDEIMHLEESQTQYVYMLAVRSAIALKRDKSAMYFINQWQQRSVLTHRKVQARLFAVMIHFKRGYWDLIQSEIVLLRKLRKENPRERKLINAFCSFLNSFLKTPQRKKELIHKFQGELAAISESNPRYFDFISFDYFEWSLGL